MSRTIYESNEFGEVSLVKFAGEGFQSCIQITTRWQGRTEFARMTEDEFKQMVKAYIDEKLFGVKLSDR